MYTLSLRYYLSLLLVALTSTAGGAQTTMSGSLFDYVGDIIDALPGADDNDYTDPSSADIATWNMALSHLMSGDYGAADSILGTVDYQLVVYTDTSGDAIHLVLEKTPGGSFYWGTYIFNPEACRNELVIMSPHPKKDLNTGKQGIYCYLQCDALAFMLAGTNRCNAPDESSCSGTTSVCGGGSSPYRISDLAHSVTSIWQHTVGWLKDSLPATYFVQLHGFTMQEDDPYVIMSNGTRETPYPDKIAALRDYLAIVDPVLTFRIGHEDLDWSRLLGFTNTNGRLLNTSPDPCTESADETSGRFLHVEQEKTRLRQDVSGWNKMARALAAAFRGSGCPAVVPLDDHDVWYVRMGMTGDGRNWGAASGYLRGVLHLADAHDTVCIGAGTYPVSIYDDPMETIELYDGITVLGGFPSTGGSYGERDWVGYETIISGEIGSSGESSDNSQGFFTVIGMGDTVAIDGVHLEHTTVSPSAALSLTGDGCVVLKNVNITGVMSTQCIYNTQELILDNLSMIGPFTPGQTLIVNQGSTHIQGSCLIGH